MTCWSDSRGILCKSRVPGSNPSGYNVFCPGYNTHTGRFSRQNGLSRVLLIETPIFAYFENQVYHLVDRGQGNL